MKKAGMASGNIVFNVRFGVSLAVIFELSFINLLLLYGSVSKGLAGTTKFTNLIG